MGPFLRQLPDEAWCPGQREADLRLRYPMKVGLPQKGNKVLYTITVFSIG